MNLNINPRAYYVVRKEYAYLDKQELIKVVIIGVGHANERLAKSQMFNDPDTMISRKKEYTNGNAFTYTTLAGKKLFWLWGRKKSIIGYEPTPMNIGVQHGEGKQEVHSDT